MLPDLTHGMESRCSINVCSTKVGRVSIKNTFLGLTEGIKMMLTIVTTSVYENRQLAYSSPARGILVLIRSVRHREIGRPVKVVHLQSRLDPCSDGGEAAVWLVLGFSVGRTGSSPSSQPHCRLVHRDACALDHVSPLTKLCEGFPGDLPSHHSALTEHLCPSACSATASILSFRYSKLFLPQDLVTCLPSAWITQPPAFSPWLPACHLLKQQLN